MAAFTILEAIARMEGWNVPNSRCRRNHNPGNIEAGRFATAHHATGADGRFAEFETDAAGFAALAALLAGPAYAGLTIALAIAKFAPPPENNTALYLVNVCGWVGCEPTDLLAAHLGELQKV